MSETIINVALAGNPNAGKTTLFNALTGSRQHVGNYPGVTVERKHGYCNVNNVKLEIVDLPGTYSLTAISEEELVARNYIINDSPQVVVNIIDSSNFERNLYLAVQLLELNAPVIVVLNMYDLAKRNGIDIDIDVLSRLLEVPVLTTVANKREGLDELKNAIVHYVRTPAPADQFSWINYGPDIEQAVIELVDFLDIRGRLAERKRWVAVKMLENDPAILSAVREELGADHLIWQILQRCRDRIKTIYGDGPEIIIADRRYGVISGIRQEAIKVRSVSRYDFSERLDAVLTHQTLGIPIFMALMYGVFYMTFTLAEWPSHWLEEGLGLLGGFLQNHWPTSWGMELRNLIVDGVIAGVGSVIVFLPNILLLFFGIALLEDTGYMARAAFIMDRFMHRIGLHGKSFIPMLIGFGCSVPAIMATRILENKRDRLTTMMVIPLMSCGARVPIYMLFIPAFFPKAWQTPILWLLYVIGIVVAAGLARLLRRSLFKGENAGLVMELPPYRMPTLKGLLMHMWHRGWQYVKKAGTVILAMSVILWAMANYPKLPASELAKYPTVQTQTSAQMENSFIGRIGHAMEPIIKPLGFDWRIGTALIGALPAKEMFVAQMGIVFAVNAEPENDENPALTDQLKATYSPLTAFCIMLFSLLASPCMATIAVTRKEAGSWGWALAQFFGLTAVGYGVTLLVYQIGSAVIAIGR
jgi:ferrous iron transport protein B